MAVVAAPRRHSLARWRRETRRTGGWGGLLYILPAIALLVLFEVWPIVFSIWISLWKWDVRAIEFIGLENYRRLFVEGFVTRNYNDELVVGEIGQSLIVTFYYVIGTVPITLFLGFILANLLFQRIPGRPLFRTLYFLPYVTNSVAVTLVFAWIFSAQVGVANALLRWLGLPTQTWLRDPTPVLQRFFTWIGFSGVDRIPELALGPSMAMVVIILFSIWTSLGYTMVIYLAGLTAIPRDLPEAARVDGAGSWVVMRSVIWPLLTPSTFFLVIVNTIGAFQAFSPIYTLTRNTGMGGGEAGGPLDSTLTITVLIFRNFYERANGVGYAAAISFFLFFIMLGLTLLQFRVLARRVHYQ